MDLVVRGFAVYVFLLLIFRISDASVRGALLLIVVLVGTDIFLVERVDEEDILSAAREQQGIERLEDIKRRARAQRRHLDRAAPRR